MCMFCGYLCWFRCKVGLNLFECFADYETQLERVVVRGSVGDAL